MFRGIRCGNLWNRNFTAAIDNPAFIAGLKRLANADLVMDTANPDPKLIADIVRLTDKVPSLRVVLDHLPRLEKPTDSAALRAYQNDLRELGKRPQIFVKVSGVVQRVNGNVPRDPAFYKSHIDELWDIFGENRLLYGSDWPNSDQWAEYPVELAIVRELLHVKGEGRRRKVFLEEFRQGV